MLQRLTDDLKTAMKAGDRTTMGCLRLVLAEVRNQEIEHRGPLTDEAVIAVLRRAVKMRQEAADLYERGGEATRATQERNEERILQAYLPAMLAPQALQEAVDEAIAEVGASSMQDMSRVMRALMDRFPGRVDGKSASELVRQGLTTP